MTKTPLTRAGLLLLFMCAGLWVSQCADPEPGPADGDADGDTDSDADADGDADIDGDTDSGDADSSGDSGDADSGHDADSTDSGDADSGRDADGDADSGGDADSAVDSDVIETGGPESCVVAVADSCIVLSRCENLPDHLQAPALACPTSLSDAETTTWSMCRDWLRADSTSELAQYINATPPDEVDSCARLQTCDLELAQQIVSALIGLIAEQSRTDMLTLVEASSAGCY